MTERLHFHFDALEKEVAAHSSPGTAEPGGLPSMGSHRVRHDWSDLTAAAVILYDMLIQAHQTEYLKGMNFIER